MFKVLIIQKKLNKKIYFYTYVVFLKIKKQLFACDETSKLYSLLFAFNKLRYLFPGLIIWRIYLSSHTFLSSQLNRQGLSRNKSKKALYYQLEQSSPYPTKSLLYACSFISYKNKNFLQYTWENKTFIQKLLDVYPFYPDDICCAPQSCFSVFKPLKIFPQNHLLLIVSQKKVHYLKILNNQLLSFRTVRSESPDFKANLSFFSQNSFSGPPDTIFILSFNHDLKEKIQNQHTETLIPLYTLQKNLFSTALQENFSYLNFVKEGTPLAHRATSLLNLDQTAELTRNIPSLFYTLFCAFLLAFNLALPFVTQSINKNIQTYKPTQIQSLEIIHAKIERIAQVFSHLEEEFLDLSYHFFPQKTYPHQITLVTKTKNSKIKELLINYFKKIKYVKSKKNQSTINLYF